MSDYELGELVRRIRQEINLVGKPEGSYALTDREAAALIAEKIILECEKAVDEYKENLKIIGVKTPSATSEELAAFVAPSKKRGKQVVVDRNRTVETDGQ